MAKQRRKEKKPQKPKKKKDMHEQKKWKHQPLMNDGDECKEKRSNTQQHPNPLTQLKKKMKGNRITCLYIEKKRWPVNKEIS